MDEILNLIEPVSEGFPSYSCLWGRLYLVPFMFSFANFKSNEVGKYPRVHCLKLSYNNRKSAISAIQCQYMLWVMDRASQILIGIHITWLTFLLQSKTMHKCDYHLVKIHHLVQ